MCKKSLFQHVARTFCGQKLFMFPLYIDIVLYKRFYAIYFLKERIILSSNKMNKQLCTDN